MLILIVVAAAIALAAFVASYESQYLAEQTTAHDKALENVLFLSVVPVENSTSASGNYTNISAVIGSYDVVNTTISEVTLNGQPLAYFAVTPVGSATSQLVCPLCPAGTDPGSVRSFNLAPDEQATIAFNLATWNPTTQNEGGMFTPTDLPLNHFITLGAYTTLGNDFTRSFLPPTAIATVTTLTTLNDGTYEAVPILDGSNSIPPVNDTISAWEWNVTNQTVLISTTASLTGSPDAVSTGTVAESGTATFNIPPNYVEPTTLNPVNLTVVYAPTAGPVSAGAVTPGSVTITSKTAPPGPITIGYSFDYTVSGAGNSGTITIGPDGAGLNYTASSTVSPYDTVGSTAATISGTGMVNAGVTAETGTAEFPEPDVFYGGTAVALTVAGPGSIYGAPTITGQYVVGPNVFVNYAFNYTTTTAGTVTIAPAGATLTYTTVIIYHAVGEKVEPSYWMTALPGTVFNVILTVVANDGLVAVAQLTYTAP
jgi:hypothetical protein